MANGSNNWNVSWSAIQFLVRVLSNHTSVASFTRVNDIQFEIVRRGDLPDVNAILIDDYMLGEAKVYALLEEFDGVTAVVNNGTWNHIAFDWRDFANRTGVAVFLVSDFLGALNVTDLTKYVTSDERYEERRKRKKSS
jgi:hypothetical protein